MREEHRKWVVSCLLAAAMLLAGASCRSGSTVDATGEPYRLDTPLMSRSISFENPTGAPGQGGKAASNLGPGRKGAPAINLAAGKEVQLCDIQLRT